MKASPDQNISIMRVEKTPQLLTRVCMHVLGAAQTDVRVKRAANALTAAGFEVSIVDIETGHTKATVEDMPGIHIKHLHMPSSFSSTRFEQRIFTRAANLFFRSTIQLLQTKADIYHAHDVSALPACYLASLLRRKPLVFEAHELPLFDKPISEMSTGRRLLRKLLSILLVPMVQHCTGIITVSSPIAREFHTLYHASNVPIVRSVPTYQIVSPSNHLRQCLHLDPEVRIALYQGNIQPNRGLDRLVRAAKFLAPNIVIVLMGRAVEPTRSQLEALINSEHVADRVKLLPPVPYSQLLAWTASADIGLTIFPPEYSLNIRFTLPNKLFEYLMAGLPVLSAQLDAVVDVIHTYDVGHVADSLAPAKLGASINTMFADETALQRMRINALQAAKNEFHWEKESLKLIRLYESIFSKREYKE